MPLSHLRVVEIGSAAALAYCAPRDAAERRSGRPADGRTQPGKHECGGERHAAADLRARSRHPLQDGAGRLAGDAQDRLRRGARRACRHRRRERLRQDHHRPVDPAPVAEQSCRPRRLDHVRRDRPCLLQHARDARDPRQAHRHDLPGADERARSGVHGRPPDRRDAAHPHRHQQGRGARQNHRHAAPCRHRLARASHRRLSASAVRRHAPAGDDRRRADLRPAAADRRRADHRARRDGAGADPRTAARPRASRRRPR